MPSTWIQALQGLGASLFDPANITGLFGKNQGPGAFLDPNGTGGGLLPGQSLGQKGVLGINPEGSVGISQGTSKNIGQGLNALGAGIAGGSTLGGMAGSGSGSMSSIGSWLNGMLSGDTGAMGAGTSALPAAASGSASSIAPASGAPVAQAAGMSANVPPAGGSNNLQNYASIMKALSSIKPQTPPPAQAHPSSFSTRGAGSPATPPGPSAMTPPSSVGMAMATPQGQKLLMALKQMQMGSPSPQLG